MNIQQNYIILVTDEINIMIFLKNSNFIGVHSSHGISKLNFDKRMTVLTGFNGAGKSTILSGIFLSLEGIGQRVQRPLFSAK